jgi:single-stranded DNA-binding protein
MVFNTEFISGGIVRQSELKKSSKGNPFIYITLAKNYQQQQEDGSYKDVYTEYTNCVAFGKTAENVARANFPQGTRLMIIGRPQGTVNKGWKNDEDGSVVAPFGEKQIVADYIGLDLSFGSVQVNYSRIKGTGNSQFNSDSQQTQPFTQSSPEPANNVAKNTFTNTFEQSTTSSPSEDPFAGLFD